MDEISVLTELRSQATGGVANVLSSSVSSLSFPVGIVHKERC